jgi:hypothetical protein
MSFSVHHGDVRIDLAPASERDSAKSWYMATQHVKQVEGKHFLHIREGNAKIKRLLTSKLGTTAKQNAYDTSLSRIDVIQQIKDALVKACKDTVQSYGDGGATRYRSDTKRAKKKKLLMPDVMPITTPKVEHVEGITMNALPNLRKLYIELLPENLSYLTDAICAQSEAGGVDKTPYKRPRTDNGDQDGVNNEDDNRDDGKNSNDADDNDSRESSVDNDIVDGDVSEDAADKDRDNDTRESETSPESIVERPEASVIKSGNMRQSNLFELFSKAA